MSDEEDPELYLIYAYPKQDLEGKQQQIEEDTSRVVDKFLLAMDGEGQHAVISALVTFVAKHLAHQNNREIKLSGMINVIREAFKKYDR
jgi:hypothetical protein